MKYDLSGTEREIMEVLWEKSARVAPKELMEIFAGRGRSWKRQTLNTFLVRLEGKELIHRERGGVEAACTRDEYQSLCCHEILEQNFGGRLANFLCAFCGNEAITKEEAAELARLIEQKVKESV